MIDVNDTATIDDIQTVRPPLARPDDFFPFWQASASSLATQRTDIRTEQSSLIDEGLSLSWLSFRSLGGARIVGYCLSWDDGIERPLLVHTHGYFGQCGVMQRWARQGMNVFGFDVRGFGKSVAAVQNPAVHGYVLTGIHSPEHSVLRGAVCDFVRAREVAEQVLPTRPSRTVFYGASFGGALAMMAAAVAKSPDLLLAAVPTFGWLDGRRKLVRGGSGHEINKYLALYPNKVEQTESVLRYFDTMNFSDSIQCPTLVGVGLSDEIVPAPTVYAIINHLQCPHEVRVFPVSHSKAPEAALWNEFDRECMELSCRGVPSGFGASGDRPKHGY